MVRWLNETLTRSARERCEKFGGAFAESECEYNVMLINYMEIEGESEIELWNEEKFDFGMMLVSWYSDSSLRENFIVAVYYIYEALERKDW